VSIVGRACRMDRWGVRGGAQEAIMTKQADFKRRVRARMAKTGESYAAARAQLLAIQGPLGRDRLAAALHVTNGDSAAEGLRATGLARRILPWRDVLHEGPVPDVPDPELRRIRAALLIDDDPAGRQACLRWLERRDHTLAANRDGEYLLWFEADLYDQLQLVQILARLGELRVPPGRITLTCIGEYLGIAHFGGLGELQPTQLHGLLASAASPLSPDAVALAARAWAALRAPDPAGLGAIAATPSQQPRFVAEAFDRLSREYPSTRDGLSLTERRILATTGDGWSQAGAVFHRIGAREARPYLGDLFCWRIMARLVGARTPLLQADPSDTPIDASTRLRPTPAGRRVLRGEADHVAQSGIDRWVGGVHLAGDDARWRWDEGTESIV
jgi:hypothetical protein